jgi:hypothetical protein
MLGVRRALPAFAQTGLARKLAPCNDEDHPDRFRAPHEFDRDGTLIERGSALARIQLHVMHASIERSHCAHLRSPVPPPNGKPTFAD